jgi:hypothetical protein
MAEPVLLSRRQAVLLVGTTIAGSLWSARARGKDEAHDELSGKSVDYDWDGKDIGRPHLAWQGRAYLPPATLEASGPRPLLVFLHGLNAALIPHRWMGGGREGDVRRIVGKLVAAGKVAPTIVAGPSSVVRSQVAKGASWNHFDLDHFVDQTIDHLKGIAEIDERRILVAGHSGAGCSTAGGLARVGESKRELHAILSIDTCMAPAIATRLAKSGEHTHVVVTYQRATWAKRPFALFEKAFMSQVKAHPPARGVTRELTELHPKKAPHDRCVPLTFERYLPQLLPLSEKK